MATFCGSAPTRRTRARAMAPSALASDVETLLVRELRGFLRELALFPDDASIWKTVPGITNSAGNLALHVAGNLQHYVGAILGGSSYRRRRDLEFSRRSGTRAEVAAELDAAIAVVQKVVPSLPPERFEGIFPAAEVDGLQIRTGRLLIHLCAHAAYHLAQAGTLRRVLMGDARGCGAIPLSELPES